MYELIESKINTQTNDIKEKEYGKCFCREYSRDALLSACLELNYLIYNKTQLNNKNTGS